MNWLIKDSFAHYETKKSSLTDASRIQIFLTKIILNSIGFMKICKLKLHYGGVP